MPNAIVKISWLEVINLYFSTLYQKEIQTWNFYFFIMTLIFSINVKKSLFGSNFWCELSHISNFMYLSKLNNEWYFGKISKIQERGVKNNFLLFWTNNRLANIKRLILEFWTVAPIFFVLNVKLTCWCIWNEPGKHQSSWISKVTSKFGKTI